MRLGHTLSLLLRVNCELMAKSCGPALTTLIQAIPWWFPFYMYREQPFTILFSDYRQPK